MIATLFGVGKSLDHLAREVEVMFYNGVYLEDAGYTQPGISQHLENIGQSALDASSAFAGHTELSGELEALQNARLGLTNADSITEKYIAYQIMQHSFTAFLEKAEHVELSEHDKGLLALYSATFTGATGAIQNSEYNVKASGFLDEVSFIARLLRPLVFVTAPQSFDS